MGKLLESSAERRLQAFRRELTLDLFIRNGWYWKVAESRKLLGLAVEARMPPDLDPNGVHLPHGLESSDPSLHDEQAAWLAFLKSLHDAVVPREHRVDGPYSSSLEFWMGFLSACVLFDPPPDDLLRFADHGVAAYGDFVNPLNPWGDDDAPQMLAPPIRLLPDPEALLTAERNRYENIIDELHRRLAPRGIDVREMVYDFEFWYLFDYEIDDDPELRRSPYIAVDAFTTEEDVRNAFKLIAASQREGPRAVKGAGGPTNASPNTSAGPSNTRLTPSPVPRRRGPTSPKAG
jgi:hypothetical protein